MRYRAIGFDWGGVLNGRPKKYTDQKIAELLGVSLDRLETAYYRHNCAVNLGQIDWLTLWQLVLGELGFADRPDLVRQVKQISDDGNTNDPNKEVLNLVDRLRSNGYKVGVLSNNSADKAKMMRQVGLDKHFDALDISVETGFVKPDPLAFAHLANGLDVAINQLVFVDDSLKSLSRAQEAGFTPILFENYDSLIDKLTKLGIRYD